MPLLSLRSVESLDREGCFGAACLKSSGKLRNRILKIVAQEQLTGGLVGDPAGRLEDKTNLFRHHLAKTVSTPRRETRAGETIAQRGENTGDPELKSLFRQDTFGSEDREETTEISPAERKLLKFFVAE